MRQLVNRCLDQARRGFVANAENAHHMSCIYIITIFRFQLFLDQLDVKRMILLLIPLAEIRIRLIYDLIEHFLKLISVHNHLLFVGRQSDEINSSGDIPPKSLFVAFFFFFGLLLGNVMSIRPSFHLSSAENRLPGFFLLCKSSTTILLCHAFHGAKSRFRLQ